MKTCQKCGKTNRNEASYCKWCGERLVAAVAAVAEPVEAIEASRADGSSGAVTSAGSVTGDGMIAKDCVKEPLASFTKRCEQTAARIAARLIRRGFDRRAGQVFREDRLFRHTLTFSAQIDEQTHFIYRR